MVCALLEIMQQADIGKSRGWRIGMVVRTLLPGCRETLPIHRAVGGDFVYVLVPGGIGARTGKMPAGRYPFRLASRLARQPGNYRGGSAAGASGKPANAVAQKTTDGGAYRPARGGTPSGLGQSPQLKLGLLVQGKK